MMWLIRLSIERPIFVSMLNAVLIIFGLLAFTRLNVDQFPKVEPPVVTVTTNYPGAGPVEVESLVSKPIEEEINQIGGIERLISTSRDGVSQVVVEFKLEVPAKEALFDVRDKISRVRALLPDEVEEPQIERLDFADRPVAFLAISRPGTESLSDLEAARVRYQAEEVVAPLLRSIDGVGRIESVGGLEREIVVSLNLASLALYSLQAEDIRQKIRKNNSNYPAGEIYEEPTRRSVRLIGEFRSIEEISNVAVKELDGGKVVTVGDLGKVLDSVKDASSFASVNGSPSVLLEVRKQSDANLVRVVDLLKDRLPLVKQALPSGYDMNIVYDGSRSIRNTLFDVFETLIIAAILAVVVVYFFLGSVQSTLITGLALPTSIIATFSLLYYFDYSLNIMTLLGLTLSVGLILDDAIVVRENIWSKIEQGMDPKTAALKGTQEVYVAVLATSLTVLAVFIPVLFLPGIVGKFFSAFAITVCYGVVFSTFDALTMAPMLSAYMVSNKKQGPSSHSHAHTHIQDSKSQSGMMQIFSRMLDAALAKPVVSLAVAGLVFLVAIFALRFVGFTFLPQDESGEIEVALEAPSGTSVNATKAFAEAVEKFATEQKDVARIVNRIGNTFDEPNFATLYITLKPESQRDMSTGQMISLLQDTIRPFAAEKNLSVSVRSGGGGNRGKPLSLVVLGNDMDALFTFSQKLVSEFESKIPQLVNIDSNLKPGRAEIQIVPDRIAMAQYGLDVDTFGSALRAMYAGSLSGVFRERGSEFDIRTRLDQSERRDAKSIQELSIRNPRGEDIRLQSLAETRDGTSPAKIIRINQSRAALIEADLRRDAPLAAASQKALEIANQSLPDGFRTEFLGQTKSLKELQQGAMIALLLGAIFIYMIMASLYESLLVPFSILLTLPLAIVGAVLAMLICGKNLDVYGVIGIILLMGLVTKNAILLVDHVEALRKEGHGLLESIREGTLRRVRPILMTTAAMVAGMLPVALGIGEVNKIRSAMGIASIGGMISSTLLSLVVVPCLYKVLCSLKMRFFAQNV